MSTSWKRLTPLSLLASALLLALGTAPAGAETVRESFTVGEGGTLIVDTDLGSVEVRTQGSDRVEVVVSITGSNVDDFDVVTAQDGDDVRIRGEYERSGSLFGGRNPRVHFEITVPERYNVDLGTAGGSITVDDLGGQARAKTSGGSLTFGAIRGPVWGRTSGGSITLASSSGEADVRTSGGSIRIGEVEGETVAHTSGGSIEIDRARGRVDAETSGGSIRVHEVLGPIRASTSGGGVTAYISEQPRADCRLTTSGGGITVYLADDVAVDLDASGSQKPRCDFELDDAVKTRTSLKGKINGGGPELFLRTSGGGVRVARR